MENMLTCESCACTAQKIKWQALTMNVAKVIIDLKIKHITSIVINRRLYSEIQDYIIEIAIYTCQ